MSTAPADMSRLSLSCIELSTKHAPAAARAAGGSVQIACESGLSALIHMYFSYILYTYTPPTP
ncbi:MAG: hypothetical protein AB7L41_13190, partial [Flavobacteriaceae bacterium]